MLQNMQLTSATSPFRAYFALHLINNVFHYLLIFFLRRRVRTSCLTGCCCSMGPRTLN